MKYQEKLMEEFRERVDQTLIFMLPNIHGKPNGKNQEERKARK
jgi:hypothetical protein